MKMRGEQVNSEIVVAESQLEKEYVCNMAPTNVGTLS
jgi:hypothetical protein